MTKINKSSNPLNIHDWSYGNIPINELKEWIDYQISIGKTKVKLDISWGYYDDIDSLQIIAEK